MKKKLKSEKKSEKKEDQPPYQPLRSKKDDAGHVTEELYGVHIIGKDDIEHHLGAPEKKSDEINQRPNQSPSKVKIGGDSPGEKAKGDAGSGNSE